MDDSTEVDILLLGDAGVGKSVFLSVLVRRLGSRKNVLATEVPELRHEDQPHVFEIRRPNRSVVRINFYDTGSPVSYALLKPQLIILCFDTQKRSTLRNVRQYWKYQVETHFNYDESLPVMLLGLKRDELSHLADMPIDKSQIVMPQEALNVAQEMRTDLYAECSAWTGQTLTQACEDVIKMALRSLREEGGRGDASYCIIM